MRREIPAPVLAVVADFAANNETHATLDSLFAYADAPGDPPQESKRAKALEWLRRVNKTDSCEPLKVLGKVIENYMDRVVDEASEWDTPTIQFRGKISKLLAAAGLKYQSGGNVLPLMGSPTKALADYIRDRDYSAIDAEFQRAVSNAETNPREAVSAASNILESLCKLYIEDEGLDAPVKMDLQGGLEPS